MYKAIDEIYKCKASNIVNAYHQNLFRNDIYPISHEKKEVSKSQTSITNVVKYIYLSQHVPSYAVLCMHD